MLRWARIEVLDNVVCLGLKQVMVTVFAQEVFYFFATDVALVFSVNSTEGGIRLKLNHSAQRLSLTLDRDLFFCNRYHEASQARSYNRRELLVIALLVSLAHGLSGVITSATAALSRTGAIVVVGIIFDTCPHSIVAHGVVVNFVPFG